MKKIIILLALLISGTVSIMATDDEKISAIAKEKFEKKFPGAHFAQWKFLDDAGVFVVRFLYNNYNHVAYLDNTGEMIATARPIKKENLPFVVSQALSHKYSKYQTREIEELIMGDYASYLVTVYSDKQILSLRIYNSGLITVIKKEKLVSQKPW